MNGTKSITRTQITAGDLAVDGIFTGIQAGIVMVVFLVIVSAGQGMTPGQVLSLFSLQQPPSLPGGLLTHLAVSSVYGILFSLGFYFISRKRSWMKSSLIGMFAGLGYGFLLWLAAEYFLFDRTASLLNTLPFAQLLVAHLIYGLALGLLVQRRQRSPLV